MATTRPERAFAVALSVVGCSTMLGGLTSSTVGGPAAEDDKRALVACE
jgi:hypothetical protein